MVRTGRSCRPAACASSTRPCATGSRRPAPGLTAAEKLEVARQLARLKVDVIEAGFPAASPGDFEAVRRIAQETPQDIAVAALARCRDGDPQRAIEAIKIAHQPHLHVFIATSDIHLKHKLRIDREQALADAVRWVRHGREELGRDAEIEFSRRGRLAHRHRLPAQGLRGGRRRRRVHGQHPGHRRLRHPVRVRRPGRARRRPRRRPGHGQRPLPQRPGAGHGQHARRGAGRRAPGRGHHQRPRRARRQRLPRGGRHGPAHPARRSSRTSARAWPPSTSPPPRGWSAT